MRRALAAAVAGALLLAPSRAAAQEFDFFTTRFEAWLDALRRQAHIPGLSAAVLRDGAIVWETGLGLQDVENAVPATPDTPYYIADLTEILTATLVLQCAEQGTIDLDTSVPVTGPDGTIGRATIRQLLAHVRSSDNAFEYSPARFVALTDVVRACGEGSFRQQMTRSILDRLAMTRSLPGLDSAAATPPEFEPDRIAAFAALVPQVAKPYQVSPGGRASPSALPPDGLNAAVGLVSTVRDLAKFDAALDEGALLEPDTLNTAWTPRPGPAGLPQPFGLGWFSQVVDGQRVVWHFGYAPGVGSGLLLKLPNRRITLIMLANSDGLSAQFSLPSGDITLSAFARLFLALVR